MKHRDRLALSWFIVCWTATLGFSQDMPLSLVLIEGEDWELVSQEHRYTEGPAVDPLGHLYFSDVPACKIYKLDTKTGRKTRFASDTARTNGLMFATDGRLIGCRMDDRQIVAYHPDGHFDVLASDVDCNDLVIARSGEIYFTDPKLEQVWLLRPDGRKQVVARDFKPNGCLLWRDEGTLVVTDSNRPLLWTFQIQSDGSLAYGESYYSPLRMVPGDDLPGSDGMTLDAEGRLYVATSAGLQMFDPTGRMGGVILKPQRKRLSNVVFAGPQLDWLYVTNGDKVFRRKTRTRGLPALPARE